MLRKDLTQIVQSAVDQLVAEGRLPGGLAGVELQDPKDPAHGDFATNFAMVNSKAAGMAPRDIAALLQTENYLGATNSEPSSATSSGNPFSSVEIAGPGFVNFRLKPEFVAAYVPAVLSDGPEGFTARAAYGVAARKINVEFVSVNPNGPITIGSGRGAAFGSALANVLAASGHTVHREYYINDGVNSEQMRQFAESVKAIVEGRPIPEKGYKGDYVTDVANGLPADDGSIRDLDWYQEISQALMLKAQENDLSAFGTTFDTWFSEQSLHEAGVVRAELNAMIARGAADDEPVRRKLKLARGGVIEDVEIEDQPIEEVDEIDGPGTPTPNPSPSPAGAGQGEGGPPLDTSPNLESSGTPSPGPSPSPAGAGQGEGGQSGRTLWLRSTKFGDDMDRVIRRRDGRLTYIASDVAYHKDKFNRPEGADKLITVLGPDHHGYISRLHAVLAAVEMAHDGGGKGVRSKEVKGEEAVKESSLHPNDLTSLPLTAIDAKIFDSPEERDACKAALEKARKELDVVIFQLVRFVKDGKPAPMRKRDGNIYALIDLIDEIGKKVKPEAPLDEQRRSGKDVARFFYLMRSHDTTFDFDLDLAEKQSEDNPVFYVQYAHARICSVLRKAEESELRTSNDELRTELLSHPKETALIKQILDFPFVVARCADDYGVHRLTTYGIDLARAYHHFYDACRVIQTDQPELSHARIGLCKATQVALQATFKLLGIEAPESM